MFVVQERVRVFSIECGGSDCDLVAFPYQPDPETGQILIESEIFVALIFYLPFSLSYTHIFHLNFLRIISSSLIYIYIYIYIYSFPCFLECLALLKNPSLVFHFFSYFIVFSFFFFLSLFLSFSLLILSFFNFFFLSSFVSHVLSFLFLSFSFHFFIFFHLLSLHFSIKRKKEKLSNVPKCWSSLLSFP